MDEQVQEDPLVELQPLIERLETVPRHGATADPFQAMRKLALNLNGVLHAELNQGHIRKDLVELREKFSDRICNLSFALATEMHCASREKGFSTIQDREIILNARSVADEAADWGWTHPKRADAIFAWCESSRMVLDSVDRLDALAIHVRGSLVPKSDKVKRAPGHQPLSAGELYDAINLAVDWKVSRQSKHGFIDARYKDPVIADRKKTRLETGLTLLRKLLKRRRDRKQLPLMDFLRTEYAAKTETDDEWFRRMSKLLETAAALLPSRTQPRTKAVKRK